MAQSPALWLALAAALWLLRKAPQAPEGAPDAELAERMQALQARAEDLARQLEAVTQERNELAQRIAALEPLAAEQEDLAQQVAQLTENLRAQEQLAASLQAQRDQCQADLEACRAEIAAPPPAPAPRVLARVEVSGWWSRTLHFKLAAPTRVRLEYSLQTLHQNPNCWLGRTWVWVREAGRPELPNSPAGQAASALADDTGPAYHPSRGCYGAPTVMGLTRSKEATLPPGDWELGILQDVSTSQPPIARSWAQVVAL